MEIIKENPLLIKWFTIPETNGFKRKSILALRVLLVSVHRFMLDDCLVIASSLAYTTIVTLIPTLTVALALITVASGIHTRQDELLDEINSFLIRNNIQFDVSPYIETLNDIISTASQIGAVGFIVFIFSATAVLRSLEKAFHTIWKIDLHRTFINKFVFYFFLISFGPLLFLVGKSITDKISDQVRAPHLKSIVTTEKGEIWVAGEKGNIGRVLELGQKISFIPNNAIDFENMLCIDFETVETGTCKKPDIKKENFFRIRNVGEDIFTISEEGTLLYSNNHGTSWKVHSLKGILVKDFGATDLDTLFILTQDTRTLRYDFEKPLKEIRRFSDTNITPIKVRFFSDKDGFILDREGRLWKTSDGGNSFFPQTISGKPLNDIAFLDREIGFLVGDNGAIFKTTDGGYNWQDLSHRKYSYDRVWVFPSNKSREYDIFILNSVGDILLSEDAGENWTTTYQTKGGSILDLVHLKKLNQNLNSNTESNEEVEEDYTNPESISSSEITNDSILGILGVGEFNKLVRVEEDNSGKTIWKKYQGGKSFFSLFNIFQILLPLLSLWLFFVLIFTLIPNTKVPVRVASLGAAVTGVILILFFWGFINIYITSFTEKTMLVYKALAAIPILLLTIYSVSAIILYGAEVTATLQFPDRYLLPKHPFDDVDDKITYEFYKTLEFLILCYEYQDKKGDFIPLSKLRKKMMLPEKDIKTILNTLQDQGFVSKTDMETVAPTKLKEHIFLADLYEKTSSFKLGGPMLTKESKLSKTLIKLDEKLKNELNQIQFKDLVS
ncbi:YhjD/YihY/BrkB family envelope integrity protein [Leptospira sp. 96542]|nr:YhjD/YihY/BrkB family envelope integrity protein [Leptospira sp. 96542]